jgi:NRPS condensation-like uncharacterized protein
MANNPTNYERCLTAPERWFIWAPYAIVTMVVRVKGNINDLDLRNAISKVQQRHTLLRVRIRVDENYVPWYTSEGVQDIPMEVIPRKSETDWMEIIKTSSKIPFHFEQHTPIRFILVHSPAISELVIMCHHIICDGLSLAYLARDILAYLGDPSGPVESLPDPVLIDRKSIPKEVKLNGLVKFLITKLSKKWKAVEIHFDQQDYEELNRAYWQHFQHQMVSVELSETQTTQLVSRCRTEKVTINSALTIAFVEAQLKERGKLSYHPKIMIASSLRDRLQNPAGESMGYYAGGVTLGYKYNPKLSFWDNARKLHQKLELLYTNKTLFKELLTWEYLDPGILESLSFKMIGALVPPGSPRHQKLASFSERDDVVSSLLKRQHMDSLEKPFLGTAVTNLTRLDFPRMYGTLELDRLIMNPGGGFPLAIVNLVVGAVTCAASSVC